MADDLDNVFSGPIAEEVQEAPVEQEQVAEASLPEPVVPEAPAEPIVEEQPEGHNVPLARYLDERDKRQSERERAERAERRLAEIESRAEPQQVPDPLDDPQGHNAYIQREIANAVQQQKVDTSWHLAMRDHGKDTVELAKAWALEKAQSDPIFRNQVEVAFQSEALPIEWVVQQHKRDAMLSDIGDRSMDDYVRDYLARNPQLMQSAPVASATVPTPASPPVKVPRSIASTATAGSDIRQTASGPLAGVDALFS